MIIGIGNDIVEVQRFEGISNGFIKKVYTEREREMADGRSAKFAANFSVKESVSKAFGTGVRGFELRDIEVLRDELGKPYVNLYGKALELAKTMGVSNIFVSISDTKELVMTMAVLEGI